MKISIDNEELNYAGCGSWFLAFGFFTMLSYTASRDIFLAIISGLLITGVVFCFVIAFKE